MEDNKIVTKQNNCNPQKTKKTLKIFFFSKINFFSPENTIFNITNLQYTILRNQNTLRVWIFSDLKKSKRVPCDLSIDRSLRDESHGFCL